MKKALIIIPIMLALGISTFIGIFYYKNLRGIKPVISDPPYPISDGVNSGDVSENPLQLPPGFAIEVFAENLSGARVLALDQFGTIWVSRTTEGIISVIVVHNGKAVKTIDVINGLDNPHGLLFDIQNPHTLYVAEEDKISSVLVAYGVDGEPTVFDEDSMVTLVDISAGSGIHYTRSLAYSPSGDILVSIGSSCNVCNESSELRASIQKLIRDGQEWRLGEIYATGLRNSVFMATNPLDGKIWATEMGRDLLGDSIPPDELNIIEEGKNYGWPVCYGNKIHDVDFDKKTYIMDPCALTVASAYDLPAHVAPLGLAFIPEESFWPTDYWLDLLVAYHGSWNRTIPIGYSVERIILNDDGQVIGEEPFIEGWLTKKNEALGRPVDLKFMNGSLYISDDKAGVIYRVWRGSTSPEPTSETSDLIHVQGLSSSSPYVYHTDQESVTFTGEARGVMYFEASFPVVVIDDIGTIVAEGIAQAQSDWMTENFVPFTTTLTVVDVPTTATGKILFKKDNPSGEPAYDYTYLVPVTFAP